MTRKRALLAVVSTMVMMCSLFAPMTAHAAETEHWLDDANLMSQQTKTMLDGLNVKYSGYEHS